MSNRDSPRTSAHESLRALSGALGNVVHTPRQSHKSRPYRTPGRMTVKRKEPTPHKARALQQKSAREITRRKSLQNKRETPRDVLRNLSRAIAKTPVSRTPLTVPNHISDNNDDIVPPVLQSDIDHSDSSSLEEPPTLMSDHFHQQDEDITIELPRREALQQRLSMGRPSLGGNSTINLGDFNDDTIPFEQENITQSIVFDGIHNESLGLQDTVQPRNTPDEDNNPFLLHDEVAQENPFQASQPAESMFEVWSDTGNEKTIQQHLTPVMKPKRKAHSVKFSQAGIQLPSLPRSLLKTMASSVAGCTLSKTTLNAIISASDKFLEQMSFDITAYAKHAGRTTVEEIDVIQLFKRQRFLNKSTSIYALACKYLPRELRDEIRLENSMHTHKHKKLKRGIKEQENEVQEE